MVKATSQDGIRKGRYGRLLGWLFAALTGLAVILVLLPSISDQLARSELFLVRKIEVSGTDRADKGSLVNLIRKTCEENLLFVDLDRVRKLVEAEKWVKTAVVRRKLPDQLFVLVTERVAQAVAAIDNELYVVDAQGVVLDSYGPYYSYLDRPIVKGLRNIALENSQVENAKRIKLYLEVVQQLGGEDFDYTESISEIDVATLERVAVIPAEDPVAIYLGDHDFRKKFETFLSQKELYQRLKERYGPIEYIDVTYDDKIIFHTPNDTVAG